MFGKHFSTLCLTLLQCVRSRTTLRPLGWNNVLTDQHWFWSSLSSTMVGSPIATGQAPGSRHRSWASLWRWISASWRNQTWVCTTAWGWRTRYWKLGEERGWRVGDDGWMSKGVCGGSCSNSWNALWHDLLFYTCTSTLRIGRLYLITQWYLNSFS